MNPDFSYETARLDTVLCQGISDVTLSDVSAFRQLMGYPDRPEDLQAPTSMGLIYGLRLGWEHAIFPPGVVRMGDEDEFGVPACAGDRLTTTFRIIERFEKNWRRFLRYEMRTENQRAQLVCAIRFVGLMP